MNAALSLLLSAFYDGALAPEHLADLRASKALSVGEVAERLAVSKFTVRSWLRQRRLSYHKLGRRVVILEADLERFLASTRV